MVRIYPQTQCHSEKGGNRHGPANHTENPQTAEHRRAFLAASPQFPGFPYADLPAEPVLIFPRYLLLNHTRYRSSKRLTISASRRERTLRTLRSRSSVFSNCFSAAARNRPSSTPPTAFAVEISTS